MDGFRPKPRTEPKRVCVLDSFDAKTFECSHDTADYRCNDNTHPHFRQNHIQLLVEAKYVKRIGSFGKAVVIVEQRPGEWHKVKGIAGKDRAWFAAMQMRRGGELRIPRMVCGGLVSPR